MIFKKIHGLRVDRHFAEASLLAFVNRWNEFGIIAETLVGDLPQSIKANKPCGKICG